MTPAFFSTVSIIWDGVSFVSTSKVRFGPLFFISYAVEKSSVLSMGAIKSRYSLLLMTLHSLCKSASSSIYNSSFSGGRASLSISFSLSVLFIGKSFSSLHSLACYW